MLGERGVEGPKILVPKAKDMDLLSLLGVLFPSGDQGAQIAFLGVVFKGVGRNTHLREEILHAHGFRIFTSPSM